MIFSLDKNKDIGFVYEPVGVSVDRGSPNDSGIDWGEICLISGPAGERASLLKNLAGGRC